MTKETPFFDIRWDYSSTLWLGKRRQRVRTNLLHQVSRPAAASFAGKVAIHASSIGMCLFSLTCPYTPTMISHIDKSNTWDHPRVALLKVHCKIGEQIYNDHMMHLKVSTLLYHRGPSEDSDSAPVLGHSQVTVVTVLLLIATRNWKGHSMPSAIQYLTDRLLWTDSDSDAWVL